MKIKVEVEVPDGDVCGHFRVARECIYLNLAGWHCDLFDCDLTDHADPDDEMPQYYKCAKCKEQLAIDSD